MGVAAWSFYGIINALTVIILRFDAGFAILVQLEAADSKKEIRQSSLFREIELLYFLTMPFMGLFLTSLLINHSFGSEAIKSAEEEGIIGYLVLIVLTTFVSRIYEARLRGQSFEVLVNSLSLLKVAAIAAMPLFCLRVLGENLLAVFQSILICEISVLGFFFIIQRLLTPALTSFPRRHFFEIKRNVTTIKDAFNYQIVAYGSQGFDLMLAGILLSRDDFGIFVLILSFANIVKKALQPLLLFISQEAYISETDISTEVGKSILRLSFLAVFLIFSGFGMLLEIWLNHTVPDKFYPGIAMLLFGKVLTYGFSPLFIGLNKRKEFKSRKNAYLISIPMFFVAFFLAYKTFGSFGIMTFCVAMFCRDLIVCFFTAIQEGYLNLRQQTERHFIYQLFLLIGLALGVITVSNFFANFAIGLSICAFIFLLKLFSTDLSSIYSISKSRIGSMS